MFAVFLYNDDEIKKVVYNFISRSISYENYLEKCFFLLDRIDNSNEMSICSMLFLKRKMALIYML